MKTKTFMFLMIVIISSQSYAVFHKISELSLYYFTSWIEIDNNLAIIGTFEGPTNNVVFFVDITDPETPLILEEQYNFNEINNISIKDSIAFVSDNYGLRLINYTDLNNITMNAYYSSSVVNFIDINENLAVFVYSDGFEIIDVSNASSPVQIVSFPTGYYVERAELTEDLLYLMVEDGIKIFDISQINNPTLIGEYSDNFYNLDSFSIDNDKVYIADWWGITVIDVSDPTNPNLSAYNPDFLNPKNISVQDGILYFCDFIYGFSIFDIQDISDPILINTYPTPREAVHHAIQDDILYLLDWSYGLQIVDMDESVNPYEVNRYFDEFSYIEGLEFTDEYIYYADMMDGLGIYERTNPEEPIYLTGNEMGTSIIYDENIVYLSYRTGSSFSEGIKFYDVSDPEYPVLLNSINVDNYQTEKIGDNLVFYNQIYRLVFLDVTDPYNPTYNTYMTFEDQIISYKIKDNLLLANTTDSYLNSIEIFDISDLNNPEPLSLIYLGRYVTDLHIFDNFLYAGYYNLGWYGSVSGYMIIDFSDPENPEIVNDLIVHSLPENLNRGVGFGSLFCNLSGTDLIIADNRSNRILTYDAEDITNPILQSEFRWNLQTSSIDFDGENLILNNWANGITELDWNQFLSVNELPNIKNDIFLTNYPNPFNPSTTISFTTPEESNVELSVYNIRGQKIRTLLNNQTTAGEHSIVWNGDDASGKKVGSGLYLYKLKINDKTEIVKKCMLLK